MKIENRENRGLVMKINFFIWPNGKIKEKYLWKDLTTLLAVYDKDNNLIYGFEYVNGRK